MPRVVLEHVTKSFAAPGGVSVRAVDDVSFEIADKELLVLVGPSGSGKTTLLRLIAGLENVSRGGITFDGEAVQARPPQARNVAMVFQSHALFPHFTAWENIAFGLKLRGVTRRETAERVHAMADMLGVVPCLHRRPAELSGGECQRIALGRALVRQPQVLVLDEPLSSLDPPLRAQLRAEIQALHTRLALTMIYVTHDQAEALALGDRVAVMRAGRLQQVGSPREIHDAPANQFVAGFIGSPAMNFISGTVTQRDGRLVFIDVTATTKNTTTGFVLHLDGAASAAFRRHQDRQLLLGFRPEHLTVTDVPRPEAFHATLPATVKTVEFRGPEIILHCCAGENTLQVRTGANAAPAQGQKVTLAFDLRQARIFDAATGESLL